MYGCNSESASFIADSLTGSNCSILHPMTIATLLADRERERHVELVRQSRFELVERMISPYCEEPDEEERSSADLWLDISHLRDGLGNWQRQLRKMIEYTDELSRNDFHLVERHDFRLCEKHVCQDCTVERESLDQLQEAGRRIRERLQDLVDEYDEHIRGCTTVMNGTDLTTRFVSRAPNFPRHRGASCRD